MKKYTNIVLKVILSLILVIPILGTLGIFPAPTPNLYNTPRAFDFIKMLRDTVYINAIMSIVFAIAIVALWTKRTALAALLILPITINIVAFHLFLDGGLFTGGAMMGNILLLTNIYLLWQNREQYKSLLVNGK